MSTTKVGLFGGSFNPPHLAHLLLAEQVREQFDLDQIWWIPAYQPPHKAKDVLIDPKHRLAMVRQAIRGNKGFAVKDLEIRRAGTSYTIETLRILQKKHPKIDFYLLIGGDSLRDFSSWRDPDEIASRVPIIAYGRPEVVVPKVPEKLKQRVHLAQTSLLEISSSEIRKRLRTGRSIRYMVPDAVLRYIEKNSLYAAETAVLSGE